MKSSVRALIAVVLSLLSSFVYAATCYRTAGTSAPSDDGTYSSSLAACQAYAGHVQAQAGVTHPSFVWVMTVTGSTSTQCFINTTRNGQQWDNATIAIHSFECDEICPADAPQSFLITTGFGWVKGFASDGRAIVEGAPGRVSGDGNTAPASVCDGTCVYEVDGPPTDFYVAKEPGPTGMHRISVDQPYKGSGSTCSSRSPELDDNVTPSCPGAQGEVNGKPVCLAQEGGSGVGLGGKTVGTGTSSQSVTGTPTASTDGNGQPEKIGPNGELPGKSGDVPSGAAGGSTPGTPSSSTPGGSSSLPSSGSDTTTKFGPLNNPATPGVPVLYERKYQGTVPAYFQEKMSAATGPLTGMVGSLFPVWTDAPGSCPQFSLSLGFGYWDYGDFQTSIPCDVWALCRIVVIISALFLARALVFGG